MTEEYLHELFGIFLHERFIPHSFIHSFIQSPIQLFIYEYELMGIYFICWFLIHYYFTTLFIAQIDPGLVIRSSFSWLLCPCDIPQ